MLSTIKIPEVVYVGFQGRRTVDEVPLGFMTPHSDDKAGQKRRDTVDNWARGYGNEKTFNSVTLKNEPMIGFKVGRSIRRTGGWNGSGASYVRVEDPRGFELEITIENLVMCMSLNLIDDGEIIAECVWGREGNRNILLPTNSEPYRDSLATTKKLSEVLSLKDVKAGDTIRLVTGEEGLYLGALYPVFTDEYDRTERSLKIGNKRYVIKLKSGKYSAYSSIKVSEIMESAASKLTPVEIETMVDGVGVDDSYNWNKTYRGWIANDKPVVAIKEIDVLEADVMANRHHYQGSHILAESADKLLHVSDGEGFEENFSNRKKQGRSYTDYRAETLGAYRWSRSYPEVHTDGWIGYDVDKSMIVDGKINRTDGHQTHINEADLKRLFMVEVTVTSKAGKVITTVL